MPRNLLEESSQAQALGRIDGLYPSDPPVQVCSKAGVVRPVLTFGTQASAVVERGFEPIEIGTHDVHAMVCDQSNQALADALAHDARLAVVDVESFFHQDGRGVGGKSFYAAFKFFIA